MSAASLTFIPLIEQLSSRVVRILGCNPGTKTLQGTNTYLIGQGKKRILIDSSGGETIGEYIDLLSSELKKRDCTLQEILISHWHYDHSEGAHHIMKHITATPIRVSKFPLPNRSDEHDQLTDYNFVGDNHVFETEGATLQAIFTPGHSKDHLCFYLKEENSLFSGDCILGETTAQFEDLFDYMNSLQKILDLNANIIYPGHGPVVKDACKRINDYINHRNMRNEQILDCLRNNNSNQALDVESIVRTIYIGLNDNLLPAACVNVTNHLDALLKQNKVVKFETYASNYLKISLIRDLEK